MTSHFSLLVKAQMQTVSFYSSSNVLSSMWNKDINSTSSTRIGNATQSGPAWCGGMVLWRNSSSVTRETWLWIKDCSWPTLGLCSLPHFWASCLKSRLAGAAVRCRFKARRLGQAAGPLQGWSTRRRQDPLLSRARRRSLLNNIWLLMRRRTSELKASFQRGRVSRAAGGSCHHGSSHGLCCSQNCQVLQKVSNSEAPRRHLHLPGAAPQVRDPPRSWSANLP